MPGLPFVSLEEGMPRGDEPLINAQNTRLGQVAQELAGEITAGRPWIEPNWDLSVQGQTPVQGQPGQAQPNITNTDPFVYHTQKWGRQEVADESQFDTGGKHIDSFLNPIRQGIIREYEAEVAGLNSFNLSREEWEQKDKQLQAKYRLIWVREKNKVQPERDKLTAMRQEYRAKRESAKAAELAQLQITQAFVDDGSITPAVGKQKQFDILGISYPQDAFEPPKQLSPFQQLRELRPVLDDYNEKLSQYRLKPGKKREWQMLLPPAMWTGPILNGKQNPTNKDYRDLTEYEEQEMWDIRQKRDVTESRMAGFRNEIYGDRATPGNIMRASLNQMDGVEPARNPLAQGVVDTRSKSVTGPVVGSKIKVRAPNGTIGSIPREELQEALSAGYVRIGD